MARARARRARSDRSRSHRRSGRPAGEKTGRPERGKGRRDRKKVLRRAAAWPRDPWSSVERAWTGHTVVILGGGPSLTLGDGLRRIKSPVDRDGRPLAIIAVNNAYQVAPHADVLYYADGRWWTWNKDNPLYRDFKGLRCTIDGSDGEGAGDADVHILRRADIAVFSDDPARLALGGNGGYQAINLAALAGAARIVLLGFDMQYRNGRQNWHSGHKVKTPERWLKNWRSNFRPLATELEKRHIEIINASEETALDAFPRRPIAELLPDPADEAIGDDFDKKKGA